MNLNLTVDTYKGYSSNWILMSCQPHRVTSGQSNLGLKQIHISELCSHTQTPDTDFQRLGPFDITPVKWARKLGHAGIIDHSI